MKIKRLNNFLRPSSLAYASLALTVMSIVLPHTLLILPASLTAGYILGLRVRRTYFISHLANTVFGFCLILLLCGIVTVAMWTLSIPISAYFSLALSSAAACIIGGLSQAIFAPSKIIDRYDYAALAVILLYFGAMLTGIARTSNPDTDIKSALVQIVSHGIDDISHFTMYQDTIEANRGLLLGSKDVDYVKPVKLAVYPKMSHTIAAAFIPEGDISNSAALLSYVISKIVIFSLIIFVLCRSASELLTSKITSPTEIIVATSTALAFVMLVVHVFFQEGFFSVWPIMLIMPLCTLVLIKSDIYSDTRIATLIAIMTVIVSFSWPVMTFPLYGLIVFILLSRRVKLRIAIIYLLALAGLIQLGVQFFDKAAQLNDTEISATGGIPIFSLLFISLSFIGSLLISLKISKPRTTLIFVYVQLVLLLVLLIAVINILKTGTPQYFFYKSALLAIVTIAPLLISSFARIFSRHIDSRLPADWLRYPLLVGSLIVILFASLLGLGLESNIKYSYSYILAGDRKVSSVAAKALVQNINDESKNFAIINVDNPIESYYSNLVLTATRDYDTPCAESIQALGLGNEAIARGVHNECLRSKNVLLVVVDDPAQTNVLTCETMGSFVNLPLYNGRVEKHGGEPYACSH